MVPSETPSRQADAALEFHLLLRHFELGGPGRISPSTSATGSTALRCTTCSAWHSKQLHPSLRGGEIRRGHNRPGSLASGCSTLKRANPLVGFAPSKSLNRMVQICRSFVTKGVLNCWISGRPRG